jgi:propionate CoA-transferase
MLTKTWLLYRIAKFFATRYRYNSHYRFTVPDNPKFMGPWEAAQLIPDGAVLGTSGLGGNQWASIMYRAIRELYQETGHPKNLTVVTIAGQGSRGLSPGSLEELGLPGLCTRLFTGHFETFKSILRLADAGQCDLQCLPQGVFAFLLDGQGRGEESLLTRTGVGTFIDPRVGRGTPVANPHGEQWVKVEGDQLRFRAPKITAAVFNAPAADLEGNIYVKNCAMIGESHEIAKAARRNNGVVIVNVGRIVEKGHAEVFLECDKVDAVVVYRKTPQAAMIKHFEYWPMFTTESDLTLEEGIARLNFVNHVLGYAPRRTEVDKALARLAASVFAENAPKGSLVNIGTGLPEEVCQVIREGGLFDDITLFAESGVVGGLPAPGVYFGTAVCPREIISSAAIFKRCYAGLDISILGMLQVDSEGNVNVSKRGEGIINYVGPGGFIDFSSIAKTVVFVGSWMVRPTICLKDGKLSIVSPGKPKFVEKVDEITFSGKQAVASGRKIFYVTNVGVFQLTPRGVELTQVASGIDIQKDILDATRMRIILPESGNVPVVGESIMTGRSFQLRLREAHAL